MSLLEPQDNHVKEFSSVKELATYLRDRHNEIYDWWRIHMGYKVHL